VFAATVHPPADRKEATGLVAVGGVRFELHEDLADRLGPEVESPGGTHLGGRTLEDHPADLLSSAHVPCVRGVLPHREISAEVAVNGYPGMVIA
jgi:hypothetical protein